MSYARQMLDTYTRTVNVDAGLLAATIDALNDCASLGLHLQRRLGSGIALRLA